jgi:hypothetical protein
MKLTESQLRQIIREAVANAVGRSDARLANRFIKQDQGAGFATRSAGRQGLPQLLFNTRKDINGQMDMLRSANDITTLIGKYNQDLKTLRYVYTYLTNRSQNAQYTAPKKNGTRTPMPAAQKEKMMATRAANAQAPQWSVKGFGGVDTTGYKQSRAERSAERNAAVNRQQGGNWISEGLFNNSNQYDNVDKIVANFKKIPQEQMASSAKVIGTRIQEYEQTLNYLKGMLQKWQEGGHLVNMNKANQQQAAPQQPAQTRQVAESIKRAVSDTLKKYLK